MKQFRRRTRICILCLLFLSVFAPIVLLYESSGFVEELSSFKGRRDLLKLNLVKQEDGVGLREPILDVYKDVTVDRAVGSRFSDFGIKSDELGSGENDDLGKGNERDIDAKGNDGQRQEDKSLFTSRIMGEDSRATLGLDQDVQPQARRVMDAKIKEMKDQMTRAKAYLNFAVPAGNTHLIKELRLRIKELERAMGDVKVDSDLSRRAFQRMRAMENTLQKAARIYPDCSSMAKKLRAMADNAEELVRVQKEQESFLLQLAGRTTPKGLHCLSMRLTTEYFALNPEERKLPSNPDVHDSNLYHFVVFSDNVLTCSVVVDSTVSSAKEAEKIVFHVVTDSLNFAAFSMWFILHPKKASVQIHNVNNFNWFPTKFDPPNTDGHDSQDPRYSSTLNHLRFYLPDIFPTLNKIVLLDHDVVVQKDLTHLWRVNMMGKVNGAVKTCQGNDPAFHRMYLLLNLSDPTVGKRFSNEACTWVFGVNVFNLQEWRKRNLTSVYNKYLQLGRKKPMWKAGTLPLGWMTFYNQTIGLDQKWQIHGLGYYSGIKQEDIEQAAVLHYDGVMKPWLDIGIEKYKAYWRKHVDFNHPYLQQCNIA